MFARVMSDKLDAGDTNTRKGYVHSIIDAVEVDDGSVRIIGSKRGFVRKWRARNDSNVRPSDS